MTSQAPMMRRTKVDVGLPPLRSRRWSRVSVYLPTDIVLRLKHAAVDGGMDFSDLVATFLRKGVEAQ